MLWPILSGVLIGIILTLGALVFLIWLDNKRNNRKTPEEKTAAHETEIIKQQNAELKKRTADLLLKAKQELKANQDPDSKRIKDKQKAIDQLFKV